MDKEELIKEFEEMMNQSKIEEKGFIMMPTIKGFDLYELPKERLEFYLKLEAWHNDGDKMSI